MFDEKVCVKFCLIFVINPHDSSPIPHWTTILEVGGLFMFAALVLEGLLSCLGHFLNV